MQSDGGDSPMAGAGEKQPALGPQGQPIKRRAPIACRRCRRMRSKCIHEKAQPPCKSCREAGLDAEDCQFTARGQPDNDRDYRHPRTRSDKKPSSKAARKPEAAFDPWAGLPPVPDLVDGVNRFTRYYFQLGFLNKVQFPEKLLSNPKSVNVFLVLSILSISARLSPCLRDRYGTGIHAAEFFMEKAQDVATREVYAEPTLERCQAFYLLSIAQQGSGLRNKSYINMGIAVRMATLMMLHREETYQMQNPTPELVMRAESARRTLWMLHSQDSLHSGPLSPVTLAASDITTLLPCDEQSFSQGIEPKSRAALDGTPPAIENPALINDPNRSLFASLMQLHHLWGIVGRRAVTYGKSSRPWEPTSGFSRMAYTLSQWEASLPHEHTWSAANLKKHKADGEDLAYLCVTMMTRLCNIVLRRPYLIDVIKRDHKDPARHHFFTTLSADLFRNVEELYVQIDAQFTDRTPDESVGAQIAAFCVYSCGLFATYLCKYPSICPNTSTSQKGPIMLRRTVAILMECKDVWPLAARWADALDKFSQDPKAIPSQSSMDDGKDPIPQPIHPLQLPPLKAVTAIPPAAQERTLPLPIPTPAISPSTQSPALLPSPRTSHPTHPSYPQPQPQPQQAIVNQPFQPGLPSDSLQHYNAPQSQFQYQQQFPQPQQQQHQQPYLPPAAHGRSSVDGMGMLVSPFESSAPPTPHLLQGPAMGSVAGMTAAAAAAAGQYFPQIPVVNDGYDGELQFYIEGGQPTWTMGMDTFSGSTF
ncbi:hypothetical protein VHEMI04090 [[Torrubiella] hemipterigena]|uniref:Zn(2)-C6 fungal-type domain-containing protein n=1 Tax=[Torrubiella] hemipterigena TaxID=1531966 RepID=A0A0A1T0D9_9HYPO|nr:hypothetical protein VHEMI04090 [[Torrubiella] hemipterigena]